MQCCALKQRAVTVLSLYLQSASPYPRKTGMEARDLGRVRLHKIQYNAIYKVKGKSRHVEQFLKNAGRTVPFKTDFWYTVYRN